MGFIRSVLSFARDVLELTRRPPVPLGLTDAPVAPVAAPTPVAPALAVESEATTAPEPSAVKPVRASPSSHDAFDDAFWRVQPLGYLPDGMLGRMIDRNRDQVLYARQKLGIKPGGYAIGGVFPRDQHAWAPWIAAWGRMRVREWLIRHASEELIKAFDRHVRMLAAQQLLNDAAASKAERREKADRALEARSALSHLTPKITSRPEKN